MQQRTVWMLAAAFSLALLGGCDKQSVFSEPSRIQPNTANAMTSASPDKLSATCPEQGFEKFLLKFIDDVDAQRQFTAKPLAVETIDALAEPEPKLVSRILAASEIDYPVMPDSKMQARQGLVQTIFVADNGDMAVKLVKPDTDYQITYYFRMDTCWTLYRKADDSL